MSFQSTFQNTNQYYNSQPSVDFKLKTNEKDILITKLKAQIYELEKNEKNYSLLTQKFRNLQNE